ncbi:MAG: FAD-dependent monooxygenase [Albidovulum sp.]|nr:FAD-dependent monooxygenase [Albidovulum sp.]
MKFTPPRFPYRKPPGLAGSETRKKAIIVGAGPIGLSMSIELANYGIPCVLVDDNDTVSIGSRAICWSKRSLELFDRFGIGDKAVEKGVTWKVGRTFHRDKELFSFDLLPDEGHKRPAFINLQQFYVEAFLVERAMEIPEIDIRFRNKVVDVQDRGDHVNARIRTPDGDYCLEAEFLVACDGIRSTVRSVLGLELSGEKFEERFLIADIEMKAEFPSERRFWFEPPFHNGQSALLHKQPDDIYRIDLQLGPDADQDEERQPAKVVPRIEKVVGHSNFRLEWVSVYTFQCRRLERFVHGRVIFAGDSAHVVSPFGARGGNGGLQDVDCLGWKLAAVIEGRSPVSLLDSFDAERTYAADENILQSTRTTKFMSPPRGIKKLARNALLKLAAMSSRVRPWVNSGRLSVPCVYSSEAADDPDLPEFARPGAVALDAPQKSGWLIDRLGKTPVVLGVGCNPPRIEGAMSLTVDMNEFIRKRYLGSQRKAIYLVRPDQVVHARWKNPSRSDIQRSLEMMWGL